MTVLPRTRVVRFSLAVLALLMLPAAGFGQVGGQLGGLGALGGQLGGLGALGGGQLGALGGGAVLMQQPGPPVPPPPIGGATEAEMFPQNAEMARQIQQTAPQYIKAAERHDRDWVTVAEILQPILNLQTDFLLKKEVKGANGKATIHYTSGRAEAERLLASLPTPGLAAYRLKFGAQAQILLAQARANPALLDEVARRFYLTDAGAEALTRLGLTELDNGHPEEAADRFRRLVERPDAADLPPLALFQAALAFHAVGDSTRETQTMQYLSRRLPPGGLTVGSQFLTLNDLQKEVAHWPLSAAAIASADSPLFRGDPRGTGRAEGDFPMVEPRTHVVIHPYDEVVKALVPPPNGVSVAGPALPGFVPLAVAGKIIYRGPDGLHALDADTGKEVWHHVPPPGRPSLSLESLLKDDNQRLQLLNQWLPKYAGLPSLLDENATLGTLSSDGRHIFFVEDVPVPAHPNDVIAVQQPQGPQGIGHPFFSSLEETLYHNRLRAVDALTGEFRWEIGGWEKAANPPPPALANVFFLGPPLPVGRRLFALVEQTAQEQKPPKNKDIVLLCLDPDTGRLLWSQDIAAAADPLGVDAARRMQPVHLAYGDGVLVCPTNTGSVVAIDPLTHDLLWAAVYHDQQPNPNGFPGFDPNQYEAAWKGCAPILQGDHVILTAPDGDAILCLNLRDGAELWKAQRTNDDLYVAGVFPDPVGGDKVLIVCRDSCRALSLAKGEEAWSALQTGQPSGLGTACGKHYLLPLRNGNIAAIDVANGGLTVLEGTPNVPPPGNLVFHGADLWSQSATAVMAYPQLGKGLQHETARLAANPKDAVARITRGRLLFSKGDTGAAVEDWRVALDDNPPAELVAPTRDRLFKALTLLLRQDFAGNERYLGLYETLCRVPSPPGATPEQVQASRAEERSRQISLLALTAHGRDAQGRVDVALQTYKQILDSAAARERMTAPDDAAAQVRPDLWVQGRIADLVKGAAPAQQKVLQAQIDQDWKAAQSAGGEAALVRFVALYGGVAGPLGAPARSARLLLVDRWMDDRDRRRALDSELQLNSLRLLADSPETAAAAQYARARLLTRHGLLADAVEAYQALARDFPAVRLPDGRTGAAPLDDLAVDKRFVAYLDDPLAHRPTGKVIWKEIEEHNTPQSQDLPCDTPDGVTPPSCRNLRFTIDPQSYTLKVAGTNGNSEAWSVPLPVPAAFLQQLFAQYGGFQPTYEADDHFLVVTLGPIIVGVDRIERRARWVRSLLPAPNELPSGVQIQQITNGGQDGSVTMQTSDGLTQRLGLLGPVGPNGVVIQTRAGVGALDVSTGDLRWLRAETSPTLTAFGDGEHLYIVDSNPNGQAFAVRAVRTADGASTRIPSAIDAWNHRVMDFNGRNRTLGRCILASDGGGDDGAPLEVRFYDVLTGQDLWKGTYPPHSRILDSTVPELTAVVTPDPAALPVMAASSVGLLATPLGRGPLLGGAALLAGTTDAVVTVVDLTACKEAARLSVRMKDVDQLQLGTLVRDRTQYYVVLKVQPGAKAIALGDPQPNFAGSMKWVGVNGMIYAFDRTTGALNWATDAPVEQQLLLLDSFEESPVLLMTAMQIRQQPGIPGGNQISVSCTRSIDKQTGKLLYRKEYNNSNAPEQFYLLEANVRTGTIDLVNASMRLRHTIEPAAEHKGG